MTQWTAFTSFGVRRGVAAVREELFVEFDERRIEEFVILVGVLGIELPPQFGRIPDLNDVERVNIRLVPLILFGMIRRFGGGDGGGNGTPG